MISTKYNDSRKQSIQHPLTGEQRVIGWQLLCHRADLAHRPHLHHAELILHAFKLQLKNDILMKQDRTKNQPACWDPCQLQRVRKSVFIKLYYFYLYISCQLIAKFYGQGDSYFERNDSQWHRNFLLVRPTLRSPGCVAGASACVWWESSHTPSHRCPHL